MATPLFKQCKVHGELEEKDKFYFIRKGKNYFRCRLCKVERDSEYRLRNCETKEYKLRRKQKDIKYKEKHPEKYMEINKNKWKKQKDNLKDAYINQLMKERGMHELIAVEEARNIIRGLLKIKRKLRETNNV